MFYDIFEKLCSQKGVSPSKAAGEIGISRATVTNWKKNGYSPRRNVLEKISSYFDVSIDALLGQETQKEKPANVDGLTERDKKDIAKDLERLRQDLESADTLMFDGDPMTDEARESILAAMKLGLEAAKLKNKEKYTPKKYKKDLKRMDGIE